MSSVLHRTHVCQWTLHRRAGRRSHLPERSSSGMQAGTVRLHKIINRIIICINPHKIAYLYLNLPLRTIYGIFFEPYAGGIYTLQIRSGRSAAPILCQLFKIIVMNNRKLLIFASFLLLAGCTTDPDTDNNAGGVLPRRLRRPRSSTPPPMRRPKRFWSISTTVRAKASKAPLPQPALRRHVRESPP